MGPATHDIAAALLRESQREALVRSFDDSNQGRSIDATCIQSSRDEYERKIACRQREIASCRALIDQDTQPDTTHTHPVARSHHARHAGGHSNVADERTVRAAFVDDDEFGPLRSQARVTVTHTGVWDADVTAYPSTDDDALRPVKGQTRLVSGHRSDDHRDGHPIAQLGGMLPKSGWASTMRRSAQTMTSSATSRFRWRLSS